MAGNKNSGKRQDKLFRDAILMELADKGENFKGIRKVAKKLIEEAEKGDIRAIKEIGDRIDGKPAQQINHADNNGDTLTFVYKTNYEPKPDE